MELPGSRTRSTHRLREPRSHKAIAPPRPKSRSRESRLVRVSGTPRSDPTEDSQQDREAGPARLYLRDAPGSARSSRQGTSAEPAAQTPIVLQTWSFLLQAARRSRPAFPASRHGAWWGMFDHLVVSLSWILAAYLLSMNT